MKILLLPFLQTVKSQISDSSNASSNENYKVGPFDPFASTIIQMCFLELWLSYEIDYVYRFDEDDDFFFDGLVCCWWWRSWRSGWKEKEEDEFLRDQNPKVFFEFF